LVLEIETTQHIDSLLQMVLKIILFCDTEFVDLSLVERKSLAQSKLLTMYRTLARELYF